MLPLVRVLYVLPTSSGLPPPTQDTIAGGVFLAYIDPSLSFPHSIATPFIELANDRIHTSAATVLPRQKFPSSAPRHEQNHRSLVRRRSPCDELYEAQSQVPLACAHSYPYVYSATQAIPSPSRRIQPPRVLTHRRRRLPPRLLAEHPPTPHRQHSASPARDPAHAHPGAVHALRTHTTPPRRPHRRRPAALSRRPPPLVPTFVLFVPRPHGESRHRRQHRTCPSPVQVTPRRTARTPCRAPPITCTQRCWACASCEGRAEASGRRRGA